MANYIAFFSFLILQILILHHAHAWADITSKIKQSTNLDEQIRNICNRHCQGNGREGKLHYMKINHQNGPIYNIEARAGLRNRHKQSLLIGSVQLYDYIVIANGNFNSQSYDLVINIIRIENDHIGLSGLAKKEEGKTHHIDNFHKYLK